MSNKPSEASPKSVETEAAGPSAPAKKYVLKHWRYLPVFEIMLFAGAVSHEDLGEAPESAWADFPHNGIDQHLHQPQLALAALFWGQDLARIPKSGVMADTPALMKLINRENRVVAIARSMMKLRLLPAATKSEMKNMVTRHFQIGETSTFSDVAALWAIRYAFSWPSSLAVELAMNKDEADSVNSERFSKALAAAISVMAWRCTVDQAGALAAYTRAGRGIPGWNAPPLSAANDITPLLLYQALEFLSAAASLDLKKSLLVAITEIALADKKISQEKYECLYIFYYSLAQLK